MGDLRIRVRTRDGTLCPLAARSHQIIAFHTESQKLTAGAHTWWFLAMVVLGGPQAMGATASAATGCNALATVTGRGGVTWPSFSSVEVPLTRFAGMVLAGVQSVGSKSMDLRISVRTRDGTLCPLAARSHQIIAFHTESRKLTAGVHTWWFLAMVVLGAPRAMGATASAATGCNALATITRRGDARSTSSSSVVEDSCDQQMSARLAVQREPQSHQQRWPRTSFD